MAVRVFRLAQNLGRPCEFHHNHPRRRYGGAPAFNQSTLDRALGRVVAAARAARLGLFLGTLYWETYTLSANLPPQYRCVTITAIRGDR